MPEPEPPSVILTKYSHQPLPFPETTVTAPQPEYLGPNEHQDLMTLYHFWEMGGESFVAAIENPERFRLLHTLSWQSPYFRVNRIGLQALLSKAPQTISIVLQATGFGRESHEREAIGLTREQLLQFCVGVFAFSKYREGENIKQRRREAR